MLASRGPDECIEFGSIVLVVCPMWTRQLDAPDDRNLHTIEPTETSRGGSPISSPDLVSDLHPGID